MMNSSFMLNYSVMIEFYVKPEIGAIAIADLEIVLKVTTFRSR